MARTTLKVTYSCTFDEAQSKVETLLSSKGFRNIILKTGENVWKNGTGMMTAMKFIKIEYSQNIIILSAWIQAGLGSVGGSEMDLTGIVGALPKRQLMKVLEEIKGLF